MTIWSPKLPRGNEPIYLRLADQLERDIVENVLLPGSRLPTHRELAQRLGVTPVTITRAYAEAASRGLIESTVGRGSFVRDVMRPGPTAPGEIDVCTNAIFATTGTLSPALTARLAASLGDTYGPPAGTERHRSAGASWLANVRPDASPERIVVTAGAQMAMVAAFAAITKPGDVVLTEEVTYRGMKSVASLLNLRLEPVALDRHGIVPDALERAAKKRGAKVLYVAPTLQNPTGIITPEKRRRDIAAVAERNGIMVVEDDVYGFLAPDAPPPITTHIDDGGIFLTGLGKSVAPALRIGYLLAPEALMPRVLTALNAMTLFTSPLGAEIATSWIEDGTALKLVAQKRTAIAARQRMARRILGNRVGNADVASPHLWLELSRPWTGDRFAEAARQRGVRVAAASIFAVGDEVPSAIRISLGAPESAAEVETALRTLVSVEEGAEVQAMATAVV